MILSLGLIGTFLLNNFLRNNYNSRKSELEDSIENFINKKVSLGDYSGIRFLGFSLGNSKIVDKKNIDYGIQAKNVYVGIMPLRSFLKQKWIVKINAITVTHKRNIPRNPKSLGVFSNSSKKDI